MSKNSNDDGWWTAFFAVLSVTFLIVAFTIELPGLNFAALIMACVLALLAVYFYDHWKNIKVRSKIPRKQRR